MRFPFHRPDTVTVYKDHEGRFRWRRVARNGRIVEDSGYSYGRKRDARRAAMSTHPTLTVEYE
jgi:uncharacterized protein YegP (UPF0339 family)